MRFTLLIITAFAMMGNSTDNYYPSIAVTLGEQLTFSSNNKLSLDFWHGLVASFSVIIVSELGDKTFFIAAILAMRHSRIAVFLGAAAALFLMTVLSGDFRGLFSGLLETSDGTGSLFEFFRVRVRVRVDNFWFFGFGFGFG